MYIGEISKNIKPRFYRAGTNITVNAEPTENGYVIPFSDIFDSSVDIVIKLDTEAYVGAVVPNVKGYADLTVFDGETKISSNNTDIIPVGRTTDEITLSVRGNVADITVGKIEIYGMTAKDGEALILPRPKRIEMKDKRVKISRAVGEDTDSSFAAEFLKDSLKERYGFTEGEEGVAARFLLCADFDEERYTVDITETEIAVRAGSRLSLLWGACRILDLSDGVSVPVCNIDDQPDSPIRGFHMGLPRKDRIEFTKRFFRYVLLPLGYNHVIFELNGNMRYHRHPEISEAWLQADRDWRDGKRTKILHSEMGADGTVLEQSEVRGIIDVLDSLGIEAIPEVQSLSHVDYIVNAHHELSELRRYNESTPIEGKFIDRLDIPDHCYCPALPESISIIKDIIDEVVEVVKPKRYVHIGHDEVYHLGLCPECRKRGAARTYCDHVTELHGYLKAKGLGTAIWSDALHTDIPYYESDVEILKHELPTDLLLLDYVWYYHLDYDTEDAILPVRDKVIIGNLYSSHFPRFAKRIAKPGMIGGAVSTWIAVSEDDYAENGKFFDLPYTAEMLWNSSTYNEANRMAYSEIICKSIIPKTRDLLHGRYDLYLAENTQETVTIDTFPGDVSRVPDEIQDLGLVEPTGALKLGKAYDRLTFAHATVNRMPRVCWQPLLDVGSYTVTYVDGSEVDIPVKYAGGVLSWNSRHGEPMPQHYYRHQGYVGTWYSDAIYEGYTDEGKPVLILGQVWDNPHPDKTIDKITYTPAKDEYAILISAGVIGLNKN